MVVRDLFDLIGLLLRYVGDAVPVFIGIIVVVIFWNLAQFVLNAGEEKEREKYKQFMIWSVISMFLLLSFWGLVYFLLGSFFNANDPIIGGPGFVDKNGIPVVLF